MIKINRKSCGDTALFNLMNTGSRPKIPFELQEPVRMMGDSICRTGFKPQGLHDFPIALPMISRGFWLFYKTESRYKGLPESRIQGD